MSHIDDLIHRLCPNGVEFRTVGDVCRLLRGVTYSKGDEESGGPVKVLRSYLVTGWWLAELMSIGVATWGGLGEGVELV